MRFPETYVDLSRKTFQEFAVSVREELVVFAKTDKAHNTFATTGTTVIALMSPDRKIGVMVSDGRASGLPYVFDESFRKIFDCRTGFFGGAGLAGLIQRVARHFRLELSSMSDARNEVMTASGSAHRLYAYYAAALSAISREEGIPAGLSFLGVFWDFHEKRCHLYQLDGMAKFSRPKSAAIGSGSIIIKCDVEDWEPGSTRDEILGDARNMLRKASGKDLATNTHMFYGVIADGVFERGEELLS